MFQPSVSKFTNEIEYQVPTSSQHDHEEDIIEIEEDREVSLQFPEKAIADGSSTVMDVQKKDEVTSAQNSADDCEVDATSTDTNHQNLSSTTNNSLPLHTTTNEE